MTHVNLTLSIRNECNRTIQAILCRFILLRNHTTHLKLVIGHHLQLSFNSLRMASPLEALYEATDTIKSRFSETRPTNVFMRGMELGIGNGGRMFTRVSSSSK